MEKAKRSQFATFLNTTPKTESQTWNLLGEGISSLEIAYNPQITTTKYIHQDNATSSHESNQKQSAVTQEIYKNEPCYEFMNGLRDKVSADVESEVLEVDMLHGAETEGVTTFPAKLSNVIVPVNTFLGENASISYTLYYNGDPVEGTVVITAGKPVFTPTA